MQKSNNCKLLTYSLCRFKFSFLPNVAHALPQSAGCVELDSGATAYDTAQAANLKRQISSRQ